MRDSFLYANTRNSLHAAQTPSNSMTVNNSGMRHSIRPRRAIAEQTQHSPQQQVDVTPFETHPTPAVDTKHWYGLKVKEPGEFCAQTSAMPVFDGDRDSSAGRAFDLLRTRLRQTTLEHGWTNIAVSAPTSGCGSTFTAVNLALSLSRITGSRTVLMDFNMRNPGVAAAFDMRAPGALSDYLDGSTHMSDHLVRWSDTLALGLNDAPHANAAEALLNATTQRTLNQMHATLTPEIVIYDMPPMLAYDDVSAFLPRLDGVLLVSDGTQTTARQLTECEQMLNSEVPLLGVVLNRARKSSIIRYS